MRNDKTILKYVFNYQNSKLGFPRSILVIFINFWLFILRYFLKYRTLIADKAGPRISRGRWEVVQNRNVNTYINRSMENKLVLWVMGSEKI